MPDIIYIYTCDDACLIINLNFLFLNADTLTAISLIFFENIPIAKCWLLAASSIDGEDDGSFTNTGTNFILTIYYFRFLLFSNILLFFIGAYLFLYKVVFR